MKILWVVNKYCGAFHEKVTGVKSTGGLWLDSMIEQAKDSGDELVVCNINAAPSIEYFVDGNISYYTIKANPNEGYNCYGEAELAQWKNIIDKERPDIIELWGTEFTYGLSTLRVAPQIPHVIFVQGLLETIGECYTAGLSQKELRTARTLRDVLTHNTIEQIGERFIRRSQSEKEIVSKAGHIIIQNTWAASYYEKNCDGVKPHFLNISISSRFSNHEWSEDAMKPYEIMCSAADYPIKGLHVLLKALRIVKESYPEVKLSVPGTPLRKADTLIKLLKQDGYSKLISKMIVDYGLTDNVTYTGRLTADEMAKKMAEVNCFVMCSAVENHSSTLLEAMTVGAPCVASRVGGVPEYAVDGENTLLYDFEDYEELARQIMKVFEDKDLRNSLSTGARKFISQGDFNKENDYEEMRKIYEDILGSKNDKDSNN